LICRPVSVFALTRLPVIVRGFIRLPGSELALTCFPLIFPAA
jgi:hypothetical protein